MSANKECYKLFESKGNESLNQIDRNDLEQCRKYIAPMQNLISFGVGLKSDGTLLDLGLNEWVNKFGKDIVSMSSTRAQTVALKSDGTVVAVGFNEFGECDVDYFYLCECILYDWSEI